MKPTTNIYPAGYGPFISEGAAMSDRERGMIGAWLGLCIGAVYGLISTTINAIVLWGVPVRLDFGAVVWSVIFSGIGLAVAGYITGYSHSSVKGVVLGALAIAVFQVLLSFFNQSGGAVERFGVSIVLLVFLLPLAALLLMITVVLRIGVNWHEEAISHTGRPRLIRLARVWGAGRDPGRQLRAILT
jgi:hypothetical protein